MMLPVCIALFSASLPAVYIALPWMAKKIMRSRFCSAIRLSGCACLTFDDGPHPESTPRILDILERHGVRATFFLIGANIEKHPGIAARIVSAGHEIAGHGYQHKHPWKCGPAASLKDLDRGNQVIRRTAGSDKETLLRPPYGKLNVFTLGYILFRRIRVAFWNIDPRDYSQTSAQEVARFTLERIAPGSVVLLHDGRKDPHASTEVTVSAVEKILEGTESRRLTLVTVSEALRLASGPWRTRGNTGE